MATHCSILAWEIPWREEPGGRTVHGVTESDTTESLSIHTHKLIMTVSSEGRKISHICDITFVNTLIMGKQILQLSF